MGCLGEMKYRTYCSYSFIWIDKGALSEYDISVLARERDYEVRSESAMLWGEIDHVGS